MANPLETIPSDSMPDFLTKDFLEEVISDRESYLEEFSGIEDFPEREDIKEEIKTIQNFIDQMDNSGCTTWESCGLIRKGQPFVDYIRESVEDMAGESLKNLPCFLRNSIDWAKVAQKLLYSYTAYEFDGLTYLGQ